MKGNAALLIGVAALLVAGGVIAVKISGGGEEKPGPAKEQRTGSKSGKPRPGTAGKSTKRQARPAPRNRGAGERPPKPRPATRPATLDATEATKRAKAWIDDVRQRTVPEKREEALNAMKEALTSGNEMEAYTALQAYAGILDVEFDRAAFRDVVEAHLDAADPGVRRAAWYAFANTEQRPEDLVRVRELANDSSEELRRSASHLMFLYEKGDFTGPSGSVVLGMLNAEEQPVRREVLRGLTGAQLSPELEAKVIALSRSEDRSESRDALNFSLSTQANKSPASVDRLIEVLADPDDVDNAGRAAWGLREGVPADVQAQVAEAALGLLETGRGGQMWSYGVDLLGRYGTEAHRTALEALASDPELDEPYRMSLQLVLQKLK